MASSIADWVLGVVLFTSSARSSPVKIGPGRNAKSPVAGAYTYEPVTSPGSMSGVHCSRRKSRPSADARLRAARVLPSPGTSSKSTWPPARIAARAIVRGSSIPTTAPRTLSSTRRPTSAICVVSWVLIRSPSCRSEFDRSHRAPARCRRAALRGGGGRCALRLPTVRRCGRVVQGRRGRGHDG